VTPYYQDDAVTIYHGDCREIAPFLGLDFAIVADPPYGMSWDGRVSVGPGSPSRTGTRSWSYGQTIAGDDGLFDPAPWLRYPEVVLWGANHFGNRLPIGTTLIWVKRFDAAFGSYLSDAEVAWMKGGRGVYCFRNTGYKTMEVRQHPTQKPLPVMRWCVGKTRRSTIIDPFMGSGTTLRAAKDLGRKAIGIEIEERYCEIAARRCAQEVLAL
jgi:site-specific DNA-methyltransferase (adenine-specific)